MRGVDKDKTRKTYVWQLGLPTSQEGPKGSKSPGRRQFTIDIEDTGLQLILFRLPELASSDCVCVCGERVVYA